MEKIIEIAFANTNLTEIDSRIKRDLEEALEHASYNLMSRFKIKFTRIRFYRRNLRVYLSIPDSNDQNINRKLRGISAYLLKKSENKEFYNGLVVGNRLLCYRDVTDINRQDHEEKEEIVDNIKIIKQLIALIESGKESDKEKLLKINNILNE